MQQKMNIKQKSMSLFPATKCRIILYGIAFVNLMAIILYMIYQPLCEPCPNANDCPPCVSRQQHLVVNIAAIVDIILIIRYFICQYRFVQVLKT